MGGGAGMSRRDEGLLLVGHGTRDAEGVAQTQALAAEISRRVSCPVETGFLELTEPDLPQAIGRLAEQGVSQLVVMPLLLFAAGHARRDIPRIVEEALRRFPHIQARQTPPLGCNPRLLELSALRFDEALANAPQVPRRETLLLMVGRGSSEADANAEMARFARLRFQHSQPGWYETCFTALAEPSLDAALPIVGGLPFRRIVVQPHLLFSGELLTRVRQRVADAAKRFPQHEWLVTEHLGPHHLLAAALLDLAHLEVS